MKDYVSKKTFSVHTISNCVQFNFSESHIYSSTAVEPIC